MPTAREIRESNAADALLAAFRDSNYGHLLDENDPQPQPDGAIRVGDVEILPGQKADKPVIRDAATKSLKKGSGRYAKANDPVLVGKATGFRQSKDYREAFEALLPYDADVTERGSLAWWFDQAWAAAEGSPQYVDCPHEGCREKHVVAFKKDSNLIFKFVELAVGKAPQTIKLESKHEEVIKALEYRVFDVTLHGIDDTEADRRRELIEGFGYTVDGAFVETVGTLPLERGAEPAASPA